jgi:hypothetical protein
MPKNNNPIYRTDSVDNAWIDIRKNFGPVEPISGSTIYAQDIVAWTAWSSSHGVSDTDALKFGKWLIWFCLYGTEDYGNLPSNKRNNHVGHCWAPCPFDSNCYNASRSETMLGYTPTSLSDHGNFYMKTMYHGSWGMECTYSGCSYLIDYGRPYFYV